jgi:hypothetical protein
MRSLQKNFNDPQEGWELYDTMFVWNEFLTRGVRDILKTTLWTVALVYGFFKQVHMKLVSCCPVISFNKMTVASKKMNPTLLLFTPCSLSLPSLLFTKLNLCSIFACARQVRIFFSFSFHQRNICAF